MNKHRREVIANNEISEIREYVLGGYRQKVMIEGKSKDLPIAVFLHGGPGSPIPFNEGTRGANEAITDKIIAVFWDQYGSGINDAVLDKDIKTDDYVDMTVDLIKALKADFPENSVNIFGVSWGSVLAAKAAQRVPELISKAAAYGQIVSDLIFNDYVFNALKEAKLPASKRKKLNAVAQSKSRDADDIKFIMGLVQKYTQGRSNSSESKPPVGAIIKSILTSPDYSFKNFKAIMVNGTTKSGAILSQLTELDLTATLEDIKIPYLILQGETDLITPTPIAREFVANSSNKNLRFEEIANTSHMPGLEGMTALMEKLLAYLNE